VLKFAEPLKVACAGLFAVPTDRLRELEATGSTIKDDPLPNARGLSWRDVLIWMSERVVKPHYGGDFFGHLMADRLTQPTDATLTVITDCGFERELVPVVNHFGHSNCHLLRLHRPGCTFERDSRSYITMVPSKDHMHTEDIDNSRDLDRLRWKLKRVVDRIMGVER
jgi:hypothetical protein